MQCMVSIQIAQNWSSRPGFRRGYLAACVLGRQELARKRARERELTLARWRKHDEDEEEEERASARRLNKLNNKPDMWHLRILEKIS